MGIFVIPLKKFNTTTNNSVEENRNNVVNASPTGPADTKELKTLENQSWSEITQNKIITPGNLTLNPIPTMPIFSKPKKFRKYTTKKVSTKSDDYLDVSKLTLKNGVFQPEINNKVSVYRPEIISMLDFESIYSGQPINQEFSLHGKYIELQHQASLLYRDLVTEFFANMTGKLLSKFKVQTKTSYQKIKNEITQALNDCEYLVEFLDSTNSNFEEISNLIDFKNLSDKSINNSKHVNLKEFYSQNLGYTNKQFEFFASTKVYYQFLSDMLAILENYSFNLVNLKDADRPKDDSPSIIDKTYTVTSNFTFTTKTLRDEKSTRNAADSTVFKKFYESLPSDRTERIKILLTVISKEYRVSKGLGNTDIVSDKLINQFGIERTGNPFNNILGVVGNNIFEDVKGAGSLAEMGKITPQVANNSLDDSKFFVFPFENKYIDLQGTNKTYIPGSDYFIDSIFDLQQETDKTKGITLPIFNTGPIKKYSTALSKRIDAGTTLIDLFLNLKSSEQSRIENLTSDGIFGYLLQSIQKGGLNPGGDPTYNVSLSKGLTKNYVDSQKEIVNAVFKLASKNHELKELLFQYLIILSIKSTTNKRSPFWQALKAEIGDIRNISKASVAENAEITSLTNDSFPTGVYLKKLGIKIEQTIFKLYSQQKKSKKKGFFGGTAKVNDSTFKGLKSGDILAALKPPANLSKSTLVDSFIIGCVEYIQSLAGGGSGSDHLINDGTNRTRYNFISPSMQFLLMYEMFLSVAHFLIPTDFKVIDDELVADTDINTNVSALFLISEVASPNKETSWVSNLNNANHNEKAQVTLEGLNDLSVQKFYNTNKSLLITKNNYKSIMEKLRQEEQIAKNGVYLLKTFANRLELASSKVSATYNSDKMYEFWKKIGKEFPFEDLLSVANSKAQSTTTAYLLDTFKSNYKYSIDTTNPKIQKFLDNDLTNIAFTRFIPREVKEVMYSYLSDNDFLEQSERTTKIFSVGIPAKFSKSLVERVKSKDLSSLLKHKESDIINIKIYKRDVQYDDLIFKPQEFKFDLSLYQNIDDLMSVKPIPGESFSKLMERNFLTDYLTVKSKKRYSLFTVPNSSNILNEASYGFLTKDEKKEMVFNHFKSYMLETYILLLTGMKISEDTFFLDKRLSIENFSKSPFDEEIETLVKKYITTVLNKPLDTNQTISELINDPNVKSSIKEKLKIFDFGNLSINPKRIKERIITPKIFDRVFHMPVNVNKFEIDVTATNKTSSGKKAWKQKHLQEQILTVEKSGIKKYYLKKKASTDTIFDEYFVVVNSTGPETK